MTYLLGPGAPLVIDVAQLGRPRIEEPAKRLQGIVTHTLHDARSRARGLDLLHGALKYIEMRR